MRVRNSKAKHFCKTSIENPASELKNEAFLRDFHQKSSFGAQRQSISARLPSKMDASARIGSQATTEGTPLLCVAGVGLQAPMVPCDPIIFNNFIVPDAKTMNRSQAASLPRVERCAFVCRKVFQSSACDTHCACCSRIAFGACVAHCAFAFCKVL